MGLVSVSLPNPGDTADASDISTPMNTLLADYNGNVNDSNIASVGGSKISSGTIPASAMTTAANPETRFDEALPDFVASGAVASQSSGLNFQMTSGVVYINGRRLIINAITATALTASKDTYVSATDPGSGTVATVTYTGGNVVANGAASPSLPANSIWLAKVVTDGTGITSVVRFGTGGSNAEIYPTNGLDAWKSWTPTWTNLTVGNGTLVASYKQVGKVVNCQIILTFGSTTSITGSPVSLTLPVLATTNYNLQHVPLGDAFYTDAGAAIYGGTINTAAVSGTQNKCTFYTVNTAGTYANNVVVTSSVPFTFGTSDAISAVFQYEAA